MHSTGVFNVGVKVGTGKPGLKVGAVDGRGVGKFVRVGMDVG